jgi:REP-associated tyrosine transposase
MLRRVGRKPHRQDCLCHQEKSFVVEGNDEERGESLDRRLASWRRRLQWHRQSCLCSVDLLAASRLCYLSAVTFYRRNLPHWHPDNRALFITWRLHGSLPKQSLLGEGASADWNDDYLQTDAVLDRAQCGPFWLKDPRIASIVVAALQRGWRELGRYDLHAYVVMANHVHVLLTPNVEAPKITKSLKGVTSRAANKVLLRSGEPFWQDESFDHWIRDEADFTKTLHYIEHNPVTARMVAAPEDWPWSSAHPNAMKT